MSGTDMTIWLYYWRAVKIFPEMEIASRAYDSIIRHTYAAFDKRVARLSHALLDLG